MRMQQDARRPDLDQSEELTPGVVERLMAGDGRAAAALAEHGESQWVELKRRLPQEPELAKELAAFANSGGGVLIVGISDSGEPVGWRPADADAAVRGMRATVDSILPNLAYVRRGQADKGWLAWTVVDETAEPVTTAEGTYWRRSSHQVREGEPPSQGIIASERSASPESLPGSGPIRVFVAMSFREEEEPALADYWQAMQGCREVAQRVRPATGRSG